MPLSLRVNTRLPDRASLATGEKLRYASVLLAYLALGINFLFRTTEGLALALALSSFSLFLYLYQWSPSKHLLKTKLNSEDLFFAATSTILFSFLNVAIKILLPIAMTVSFTVALGIIGVLAGGGLGCLGLYFYVQHVTHHSRFIENLHSQFLDMKLRGQYERLGNSIIVASTFLAIDAPDLMLIIAAIVLSFELTVGAISSGMLRLLEMIPLLTPQSRTVDTQMRRFMRSLKKLDLEEAFWNRVLYVLQYKRGFSYFLLALFSGFPAMIYSYLVDFFAPELGKSMVFLLLALPGVMTVYTLKLPKGLVSAVKDVDRLRQILFAVSLVAPLATIPAAYLDPSLLGYGGRATFSDLAFMGSFFGFVWLATIPIVFALPSYSMFVAVEFEDYPSFIRGVRLLAMSPSLATALMAALAVVVSNISFPTSVALFALYTSFTCYFYPIVVHLAVGILRDVQRRTNESMQQWVDKVRGSRWSADLLAIALGSFFFPLLILAGTPYPWFLFRQGFLFPHVVPTLVWTIGGFIVTSFVSLVFQPAKLLDFARIGFAGSLGVLCQAISFFGLPYALTIWVPWVMLIPTAFIIGSMILMTAIHLIHGARSPDLSP